jgi:putative ABC transport system ATP-binding protein
VETIQLRKVRKRFETSAGAFTALDDIDLGVKRGEFLAVVGKSGSGKSTLLNMLAGIDRPTSGEVLVADTPVHTLTQDQLAAWRGKSVGVVFQFFQLLPTLTALENVMLPMDFSNTVASKDRTTKAIKLLERVGVTEQAHKLPSSLSGGQQQRVAIARALANDPPLLLADEPTGNLDSRTAEQVLNLFADLAASGKTVVMVTHERDVSAWVSRTVTLADGRVIKSEPNPAWGKPLEVNHA